VASLLVEGGGGGADLDLDLEMATGVEEDKKLKAVKA
jgi:hypothetical protein